ncbi:hemagglutinin amebocyte aggregation factor-like protein [Labeo rohita]|uniref:Hemagglutinin amebocyte aggregation factor-like protein n=1 Tax=Labeo rohita TaxID=84645 RepID=A0A498N4B5_LABRO|nr:hemagglutinin amebocyte aggregation factor-like protein [Labeo rohita]
MGQMTKLMNGIDSLKDDERNLNNVEEKLQKNFSELNKEFTCLNAELGVLLSEEERNIEEFVKQTQTWILTAKDKIEAFNIGPKDSVSVVSLQRQKNKYGSVAGRMSNASRRSSSSAAHLKQEAEQAALLARAAALKKKQSTEQEVAKLKAEQEQLEIDTEIGAYFAKLKVFKDYDLLLENESECQSGNADICHKKEQKNPSLVEQHSQSISSIRSEHHNAFEDRRWELGCKDTFRYGTDCFWSPYVNYFDEMFSFECPPHHVITGMSSHHNDNYEDRRWQFYCCRSKCISGVSGHCNSDCLWTTYVNSFDEYFHWTVPPHSVLVGAESYHDDSTE